MTEPKTNFYQQTEEIKNHYEKLADKYNSFWGDSPELIDFYSQKIVEYLELKPTDNFVDLGCGTGIYTKKIRDLAQLINPVICVDISAKMLENIPNNVQFKPIVMDARLFAEQSKKYDKVLMQKMLHHIKDIKGLIENLFDRLNPGGKILTIGIPRNIEYLLFDAAFKRYQELHPVGNQIRDIFTKAGFKFTRELIKYPVSIEKHKYLDLIRNRYISTLSSFSEGEIEEGIKELEQKYSQVSHLNFNECFIFLLAAK